MDLSVVIVNWNTRDLLRECLTSLRAALDGSPLESEVILIDNGSADGSAAMASAEFPEVRLVANSENRNYAAGNNQGLALARGEFVFLLNPDTIVPSGAPDALVAYLRENPETGMVAPALVHADGRPGLVGPVDQEVADRQDVERVAVLLDEVDGRTAVRPLEDVGTVSTLSDDRAVESVGLLGRLRLVAVGIDDEPVRARHHTGRATPAE